jgi:hypothetical protein
MIHPNMIHQLWTHLRSQVWSQLFGSGLSLQDAQGYQMWRQQTQVFDPVDDQITAQLAQAWEREVDTAVQTQYNNYMNNTISES